MLTYLWLGLGGAIGTVGRFWLDNAISNRFGRSFPLGILAINVTGSFLIGILASLIGPEGRLMVSPTVRMFFMIGICGGYTTFSSFSLNTLNLIRERQWLYAGVNVVASVVLCLLAVWLGYVIGAAKSAKTGG
jgi:fluoride exporter